MQKLCALVVRAEGNCAQVCMQPTHRPACPSSPLNTQDLSRAQLFPLSTLKAFTKASKTAPSTLQAFVLALLSLFFCQPKSSRGCLGGGGGGGDGSRGLRNAGCGSTAASWGCRRSAVHLPVCTAPGGSEFTGSQGQLGQ